MCKALFEKGLQGIITLFCATLLIFILTHLAPGDPVSLLLNQPAQVASSDTEAYEQKAAELRAEWGLDQNILVQYATWMGHLARLDLGTSMHTGRDVGMEIAGRLPATMLLSLSALVIQVGLGLLFGIVSALHAGKSLDTLIRFICVAFASLPAFVIGLMLLSLFAVTWHLYEISSDANLSRLSLPAITLGLIGAPQLIRLVRANMLSEFGQSYILSALSRGLSRKLVVGHALRNAYLPIVTMVALSLTTLISGAVVIESIFSWPGIGKYALDSILVKDYPVIQGYAFVMVTIVVLIHVLVDVVYILIDPRISYQGGADAKAEA
ncbi:ABC transporter permease [Paenibacillus sp. HWE-109]|uniref:ABC transporter permease n=1 Tax=Paenibacillus sp. HWE-109 TaxID=1306526 RepID=UPI001EDDAD02|nr:ABC transporter permease [Paenibacillus sp. HWE-109]UKS29394.1 ABC transporter permease [Paenibacillus sp. HWE-109]